VVAEVPRRSLIVCPLSNCTSNTRQGSVLMRMLTTRCGRVNLHALLVEAPTGSIIVVAIVITG
jgi:hypothetical protein